MDFRLCADESWGWVHDGFTGGRLNPLIETSDFEVGPWRVRPSRSELRAGETCVRLEPRVMAVLVALARRQGETVARERLIAEVWDGRVVTDDAVQRCIAALRKILRSQPGADIETIPKLGYALRISAGPAREAQPVPEPARTDAARAAAVIAPAAAVTAPKVFRSWPFLAVGLLLLLGAGLWWVSTDIPASSAPGTSTPRARPLTSLRGREVQAALSPSGGQVAFVWWGEDGRNADIYVKAVNGEGLLRLTEDAAADLRPVWSADGGELAFIRVAGSACTLLRIAAIGGAARRVADCGPGQARSLDWSPDGTTFAIATAADDLAPATLQLIAAGSGEARTVSAIEALAAGIEDARFSPDGGELAFSAGRALGVEDVHVYRFADRSVRRLTFDRLKVHHLDWAADGRAIVFSSNRGGPFRLWQVAAGGGEPALVPGAGDAADDPSVASNGRIAYEVWRMDAEIMAFSLADPAAPPTPLVTSTRFEWDAQVSPDGERIAYVSDRSGAAEVWVAARDGSDARQLTTFAGPYTHSPRWSPDGSRLAFVSPVSGRMNLFVMSPDEARPQRIGADDVDYLAPAWTHDATAVVAGGRRVVGTRQDHTLWRVPADGSPAQRMNVPGARSAQLAADGSHLFYTKVGEPGIWRREVAGTADERRVIEDLTPVDWNNWVLTPAAIYYVRRAAASAPRLIRFDLQSGAASEVRALGGLLYKSGLWVSADERELLATVVVSAESDLALVEGL